MFMNISSDDSEFIQYTQIWRDSLLHTSKWFSHAHEQQNISQHVNSLFMSVHWGLTNVNAQYSIITVNAQIKINVC